LFCKQKEGVPGPTEMRPAIDLRAGVVKHKVCAPMMYAAMIILAVIIVAVVVTWLKPEE
jgi:hypothetical protein